MRPLQQSAEHKRRENIQRIIVKKRDINRAGRTCCQFDRLTSRGWEKCGVTTAPLDTAHVINRRDCAGAWDAPKVAIAACRSCHNAFDRNELGESKRVVRVPYDRAKEAWDLVLSVSKVRPSEKWNPDENPAYDERRLA